MNPNFITDQEENLIGDLNKKNFKIYKKNFKIYTETYNKVQETNNLKKAIQDYPKFLDISNYKEFNIFMLLLIKNDKIFKDKKIKDIMSYEKHFHNIKNIKNLFV